MIKELKIWYYESKIRKLLKKKALLKAEFAEYFHEQRVVRYQHAERQIIATEDKIRALDSKLAQVRIGG